MKQATITLSRLFWLTLFAACLGHAFHHWPCDRPQIVCFFIVLQRTAIKEIEQRPHQEKSPGHANQRPKNSVHHFQDACFFGRSLGRFSARRTIR
jgi:hypothetical protein